MVIQNTTRILVSCYILLQVFITSAFSQAIIQFDTSHHLLNAGHSISICLTVKNGNFISNNYEIEVEFTDSALPHFPGETYRKIHLQMSQYCFQLKAGKPNLIDPVTSYTLSVSSLNTSILVPGQLYQTEIIVNNHVEPVFLGPKDLIFIGYDNEKSTSGTDEIAVLNLVPISKGTFFLVTNAMPLDSTGRYYRPYTDSLLTIYRIEYTGLNPIPPYSKISFDIISEFNPSNPESLGNFAINSIPSSEFSVTLDESNPTPSLNIEKNIGSGISLFSGQIKWLGNSQYELLGNLIDAIVFLPDSNLTLLSTYFHIMEITLNGSSYGLLKCNGDIYLCDFTFSTASGPNWFVTTGTSGDNLNTTTILDTCNINQCPPLTTEITSDMALDSMDIIFLLDDSRSIDTFEYEDMKASIIDLMYDIHAAKPNTRFAVIHYAEADDFDVTVPFTFSPSEASNFSQVFDGGETFTGIAVNNVMDEIAFGQLPLRLNAQFNLLIFTDNPGWLFITEGYNPYNTIKVEPFHGVISTIRYQSYGPDGNTIAASTTSTGGHYYGPLDNNPGDPDGTQRPRRFYTPDQFDDPLDDLLANLLEYYYLEIGFFGSCDNPAYEWNTENGGEILSINGALIETNGVGFYTVNISCDGTCMYSDTFDYEENLPIDAPLSPSPLIDFNVEKENAESNSTHDGIQNLIVTPTLSPDYFYLRYTTSIKMTNSAHLYILDANGIIVDNSIIEITEPSRISKEINLSHHADGMYFIRLIHAGYQEVVKIIKIHK